MQYSIVNTSQYKKTWRALPTILFNHTLTSDHAPVIEHPRCKMESISQGLHRTPELSCSVSIFSLFGLVVMAHIYAF